MLGSDGGFGRVRRWMKACLFAASFALVALPAAQAPALDKDQIIQMSKMGIDKSAIKGAIDSSEESLDLSPEEVEELRAQGVGDEIIAYLKKEGHVAEKKKTEGKDQKQAEGDRAEGEGTAGAKQPPDEGDEEGEKTADRKEKEGDEETSGDETTPAPAPGGPAEGQEEETLTKEELEERIEKEREKAKREAEREREKQKRLQRAANRFPDAERALENENYMEAARIYLKFLSIGPEKGTDNWYRAQFGLGKALYNQGILSGATKPIQEVVMQGSDREHFEEAFGILEELTRKIGYQPPALEELTKFQVKDLPPAFQNEFHYYVGKFFYDYDRNELAVKHLEQVEEDADDFPESRYLMGVARLDPAIDDKPAALRNFETAITAGERQQEANEEILHLGYLALARVFYEVGIYDVALFYYQKIPRDSSRHAEAMFEKAWTYFLKNDFKKALGTFHTLHSPYYEKWYFPDLFILESTVYLNLCRFDESKRALAEFEDRYLDKRPRLQNFLKETTEPKAYWNKITNAFESDGVAESGTLPPMFVNAVLDELEFFNIYKVIRLLREEREALKANIDSLGDFGQRVLDRVNEQLETKIQEGGILVQQKLTEIDQELKDWDLKATQISFDIDSEEKQELEQRLRNKDGDQTVGDGGTTLLIVADDWQPWPFEGEYWFDEVANYRSRQSSKCIQDNQ